jgi:hypothetical protein
VGGGGGGQGIGSSGGCIPSVLDQLDLTPNTTNKNIILTDWIHLTTPSLILSLLFVNQTKL